jgi:DNA-binding transcriptional regulator GbsR (MarR family)
MQFEEAKQKFIQSWGVLASNWGINRTMAQIHALLLASHIPLTTEDMMAELSISRGNANMNIRALMDWGLVYKEIVSGERKEFFRAEKDMYKVAKQIVKIRREKEINPIMATLNQLQQVEGNDEQSKEFIKMMKGINDLTGKASNLADKMLSADETWFGKAILKLVK